MFREPIVIVVLILSSTWALYFEECADVAEDSFIAVANDCHSFIYCSDEESSFQDTCPDDTYFDVETKECQIDYDNICPAGNDKMEEDDVTTVLTEMEIITTTTPSSIATTSPHLTTIYEHVVALTSRPKCSRHKDAYYPHFHRCEYYFKCVAGYLTILRCNFYHAWDYQKEMCVPYNMVKCYGTSKLSNLKPKLPGTIVKLL
ncbi:uncharacterized protein LOC135955743 [Calliphora vicina]|uniref:uncharacterized protein LOC135955743 n=1 Tax=Calliphora vicina TaxID=7373 RepID=UPI00325BCD41